MMVTMMLLATAKAIMVTVDDAIDDVDDDADDDDDDDDICKWLKDPEQRSKGTIALLYVALFLRVTSLTCERKHSIFNVHRDSKGSVTMPLQAALDGYVDSIRQAHEKHVAE
eukprot:8288957-Karenia_brevis.AAC.1